MKFAFLLFLSLLVPTIPLSANTDTEGEAEFVAVKLMAEQLATWLKELKTVPESVGIFQINMNPPFNKDFARVVEIEILKQLRSGKELKVVSCEECQVPQLRVQDDRVIISKGSPDIETLKAFSKKLNVNTFLTLEVYRTKLSVVTMAKLHHAGSGEIIATESFRVAALNFNNAATQFMFHVAMGSAMGGKSKSDNDSIPMGGTFMLLEELGFGKGGLALGGAVGNRESLLYIAPSLAWRGSFGSSSSIQSLKNLGVGFGRSADTSGVAIRAGYDVLFGTFTGLGVQANFLIPVNKKDNTSKPLSGFIGLHIIFNLGS